MKKFVLSLFGLSLTLAAQTGRVDVAPLSGAACGTVQVDGRAHYVCDWEPHLRQAIPAAASSDGSWGSSIGSSASYCLRSGGSSGYQVCGAGVTVVGSSSESGSLTALGNLGARIPGYAGSIVSTFSDNDYLTQKAQSFFDRSYSSFTERISSTQKLIDNLNAAQGAFASKVVVPSIGAFEVKSLETLAIRLDQKLAAMFAVKSLANKSAKFEDTPLMGVSEPLRERVAKIQSAQSIKTAWEEAEPVWQVVVRGADKDLDPADAAILSSTYAKYFNNQGLLLESIIGKELAERAAQVGSVLQTSVGTAAGREVRLQINRNLVAAASSLDDDQRSRAWGGVALALGADQAFTEGARRDAAELLRASASVADTILGFIPIVGAVNDATQILFGMATGHDYTGSVMTAGDFGLRGVGMVLGLLPAKAILTIGGKVLDAAYVAGAGAIRRLGMGARLANVIAKEPEAATEVAQMAAHWVEPSTSVAEELSARKGLSTAAEILEDMPGLQSKVAAELNDTLLRKGLTFHPTTFTEHFQKHVLKDAGFDVASLGIRTPQQYLDRAIELAESTQGVERVIRPKDGATLVFRKETGEFLVMKDTEIFTFFKPRDPTRYWADELKKIEVWKGKRE